jgi:hypothetical protein
MDTARTLMNEFDGIPESMWAWAASLACYIINRTPAIGKPKTPHNGIR